MKQAPKTYRINIYAQAPGPNKASENIMSFSLDSHVTNGLVLTYPGAKPIQTYTDYAPRFNSSFSDRYTAFLTNTGKAVYTNLPLIIEEE